MTDHLKTIRLFPASLHIQITVCCNNLSVSLSKLTSKHRRLKGDRIGGNLLIYCMRSQCSKIQALLSEVLEPWAGAPANRQETLSNTVHSLLSFARSIIHGVLPAKPTDDFGTFCACALCRAPYNIAFQPSQTDPSYRCLSACLFPCTHWRLLQTRT